MRRLGLDNLGLNLLLVFVPASFALELFHADPLLIFISSSLAIVPLASLMGKATEQLASHVGAGLGALLNASLGNAAELIIALVALREGLHDLVKASITGSIIGNILLVLGLSMVAGGLRYDRQRFNPTAAGMGSSLLLLSAIGLVVPALFHLTVSEKGLGVERELSLEIAVVLFAIYLLSLVFSLKTHHRLFSGKVTGPSQNRHQSWRPRRAIGVLLLVTVGIAVMSEFLVGAIAFSVLALVLVLG